MKIKRGDRGRGQRNSLRFAIGAALAQEHGAVIKSRRDPAAVRRPGERRDGTAAEAAVRTTSVDFIEPRCPRVRQPVWPSRLRANFHRGKKPGREWTPAHPNEVLRS